MSLCVVLGKLLTTLHPRFFIRNTHLPQMGLGGEDYREMIHVWLGSL